MICRVWKGWTRPEKADAYELYLKAELFPKVERELRPFGFRGYHLLRVARENEVEFVTMLWFESLDAVKSFAGPNYRVPVISERAHSLLSHYAGECDHYELRGAAV